ncbi:MAG: lysophospholipid acyltransferase family protein [Eubacteriales bacterium]
MIRTIIWFFYFWLYLIAILPALYKANHLAKKGNTNERDQLVYRVANRWAQSMVNMTGSTIKVTGKEHVPANTAVVFVSNHQGNFDIPILIGFINKPKAFIAKIELLKLPLIRSWMKHLNCVFMDRSDMRQSLRTIKLASDYLKEGYSMVIFPEGTRSKGNTMGDFKPGSIKLALKAEVPIIPITIRGSYKIMEQNRFGITMKPAIVEIIISEPVSTTNLTKEQAKELPDKVKEIIQNNLN